MANSVLERLQQVQLARQGRLEIPDHRVRTVLMELMEPLVRLGQQVLREIKVFKVSLERQAPLVQPERQVRPIRMKEIAATTTLLRVSKRFLALRPEIRIQPTAFTLSITTRSAALTRPTVTKRSLPTPPAASTRRSETTPSLAITPMKTPPLVIKRSTSTQQAITTSR